MTAILNVPLVIDDLDPTKLVSANVKLHRAVAGKVRAYWRQLAHDTAVAAYGHADDGETWHTRVHITLTFRFPTNRRRDTPNLYSYVGKPIVDGLVDAQIVPDDDDFTVIGPDMRRDPEKGEPRILITIEDLPQKGGRA